MKPKYEAFGDPDFPEPDPRYWWPDWYIVWLRQRKKAREKALRTQQLGMALEVPA